MDALSEILRVVQLNGAIFFNARFTAPWCVASPAEASLAKTLGVGAERVLLYHYMRCGSSSTSAARPGPPRVTTSRVPGTRLRSISRLWATRSSSWAPTARSLA